MHCADEFVDEAPDFLGECPLFRENLERIVAETEPVRRVAEHWSAIEDRLTTIEEAARRVGARGGGVLIW
ncbi:hypothetical protein EAO77_19685 [Streptomyces sp. t39]|nr:hypothetical protein EAO77_19685 [Streptomyces sp. t39]